jgi:hypothetical protein
VREKLCVEIILGREKQKQGHFIYYLGRTITWERKSKMHQKSRKAKAENVCAMKRQLLRSKMITLRMMKECMKTMGSPPHRKN